MARKRFSDEDVIRLLSQIEVETASGVNVANACRSAGVSDAAYYGCRKKFGGIPEELSRDIKSWYQSNIQLAAQIESGTKSIE